MKALKATLLLPFVLLVLAVSYLPFFWEDLSDLWKELRS